MEFDRDDIRRALTTFPCRHCGAEGAAGLIEDEGPHFARIECGSCGAWLDWIGWPKDKADGDRKRSQRVIARLDTTRCEICLRDTDDMPAVASLQTLVGHHVIEKQHGGTDDPSNLRAYCASCHALVHWVRTYFGHYHQDEAA